MEQAVAPEIPVFEPETARADDAERNCGDQVNLCLRGILCVIQRRVEML